MDTLARPEKEPKTALGARMREIRRRMGDPERDEWALSLGVSKNTIASYERGDTAPDADVLARYRTQFGININWIATGEGEIFADASKAPASKAPVDPELMELIYKGVESVHRAKGLATPPHRIAVLATHMYNDLQGRVSDLRDTVVVDAVLPVLRKELDDRLEEAKVKPGTGKRTAS